MQNKDKKSYGLNIDFNSYGLKSAGSYIDALKKITTDFDPNRVDVKNTAKPSSDINDLNSSMSEADAAAKKLIREMEAQNTLTPDAPKTEAEKSPERPNLDELLEQLDSLVGLDKIKQNVRSLINLAKVRKLREEQGLPIPAMSLHLVFMGNPGTGKTTVARLIAQLYYAIGVLSKGQLVEVDRSGLVAGFVGQTAIKTDEAVKKALGGVLFVDEAYSLTSKEGTNDFGHEAVETILKAMEDNRDDFVVIVAGYEDLMEEFLSSNPGLESRFNRYFVFEDYDGEELFEIFSSLCKKNQYVVDSETEEFLKTHFKNLYDTRDENFGNARDVRNFFENVVSVHADRVATIENPTKDDLTTVIKEDAEKAAEM
jgi:SpoVK/Ycf46/Vps4 family AAA+-type ATPase